MPRKPFAEPRLTEVASLASMTQQQVSGGDRTDTFDAEADS